jgi:hypothetical protein
MPQATITDGLRPKLLQFPIGATSKYLPAAFPISEMTHREQFRDSSDSNRRLRRPGSGDRIDERIFGEGQTSDAGGPNVFREQNPAGAGETLLRVSFRGL